MSRVWRPVIVGAVIVLGVFALAKARVFEPSTATGGASLTGDVYRGEIVFERTCAGCHGSGGVGGDPGPRLVGSGIGADRATSVVDQGTGVMPPGLVSGQQRSDVVAYVVSIAEK